LEYRLGEEITTLVYPFIMSPFMDESVVNPGAVKAIKTGTLIKRL
jgi:hypothetical protein